MLLASLASVTAAGCAGQPPQRPRVNEIPASAPETAASVFTSPARWSYHPPAPEIAEAWLRLPDGGCVLTADGGQRWTVAPIKGAPSGESAAPKKPCAGRAQAASYLAPEDLSGVVRRPGMAWIFVGASGTLYEAATPLGPFTRSTPPPEPLARVAGAGSLLLGTTLDGKLLRWTDADGWQSAPVSAQPGGQAGAPTPSPLRVFDVAATEGGRALALAVPEALLATDDGGSTWKPSPLGTIGAQRVGLTAAGDLGAQGLTESITWDPRRPKPFALGVDPLAPATFSVDATTEPAPSATAALYGRGVISGDRYYEVDHRDENDEGGRGWVLLRGRLGEPLTVKGIPRTDDCGSMKLGATGKQLVAACVRALGDSIIARITRSEDEGDTWTDPLILETLDTDSIDIAVSPYGPALISGVCRPPEGDATCKPGAPLLFKPEGRAMVLTPVEALNLEGPAIMPAFSVDGRSAYFLGSRSKDARLTLFVSHDGGESFAQRALEPSEPKAGARAPREDEEPEGDDEPAAREAGGAEGGYAITEDSSLKPGEDGTVGMVLAGSEGLTYITTDEDGRVRGSAPGPVSGAQLAGFGARVVALGVSDTGRTDEAGQDGSALTLWESLNGGGLWSEIPATPALTRDFFRSPSVACGGGGCLFGDTLARVGWGGQAEPPAARPLSPPVNRVPSIRTPIVCELAATSRWTRVDNVHGAGIGGPDANEAMRGRSAWSVLTFDQKTGATSVVAAMLPESGEGPARVVTRPLFGRSPAGSRTALDVSHQMEGYAAARVRFEDDGKGGAKLGVPMRGVEVAWENFLEGTSGRATIPDAGPFELGDVKPKNGELFDVALLSVSLRGIFVRPHSPSARSAATFFLEPGGKSQRFEYPSLPERAFGAPLNLRTDAVVADDQLLVVGMEPAGNRPFTTVLLAHRANDAWVMNASAIAPAWSPTQESGGRSELSIVTDWTYAARSIGVTTLVSEPKRGRAFATFQAFRGDGTLGPAVPLPTPFDAGESARPCAAGERKATARFEAPLFARGEALFPGTRHPVLVTDLSEGAVGGKEMLLLTSSVVLHGTPGSPCVAAWDAFAAGNEPASAILSGDLTNAWLFRRAEPTTKGRVTVKPRVEAERANPSDEPGESAIEYRPMTCRKDPAAKVPDAVWNEAATFRLER